VLHLKWRESGGPAVMQPEREGFGTRMIRRVLASELGGKVKLEFEPDGLECSIDAPLTEGASG
jgi:two-component sensor histidine kinase